MIPPRRIYVRRPNGESRMNVAERDRIRGHLGVPCEVTHLRKRVQILRNLPETSPQRWCFCFAILSEKQNVRLGGTDIFLLENSSCSSTRLASLPNRTFCFSSIHVKQKP